MSIPGAASPLFLTSAAADAAAHQIDRSLRFNSADSAYLSRTPSSAGNRRTWSFSAWIKLSDVGTSDRQVFSCRVSGTAQIQIGQSGSALIGFNEYGIFDLRTDRLMRDPGAWFHLVCVFDSTNSTEGDRARMYINGVRQTDFSTETYPSQNAEASWNRAEQHNIGSLQPSYANYFDGYMAEIHFCDGQALAASDFGEYDDNNVWRPKDCQSSLTYGTNGFYLKFADNSSNSALGTDSSGNSNTWTVNNFTASALATGTVSGSGTPANASGSGGWAQAFDGSTSTLIYNSNGSTTTTFTLSDPIAWTSKIRIYAGQNGTSGTNISANGVNLSALVTWPLAGGWQEVTTHLTSPLTSLALTSVGGQSSNIRAVEIDNTVIVQGDAADIDSLIDTPTNYTADSGNNGGNYCTMNPLKSRLTLSNGNLDSTSPSDWKGAAGTIGMSSGKYYWEIDNVVGNEHVVGIVKYNTANVTWNTTYGYGAETGVKYLATGGVSYGAAWTTGDVIGVAFDADNGNLEFYKNGTSQGVAATGLTDGPYLPSMVHNGSSRSASINFGQRPWHYSPKADHVALCTTNLADPTIADGSTAFEARTYDGVSGASSQTGYNFGPDFVWIKRRNSTNNHTLTDIVRGAGYILQSHNSNAEIDNTAYFTAFTSDGYSFGTDGGDTDASGGSYVAWAWDGGTSTASNTDGSITSNVRANTSAGFSICTYTSPNSSSDQSFGHGLNAKPDFVIVKNRDSTYNWDIYHSSLGYNASLIFTSAATRSGAFSAEPTSSVVNTKTSYTHNGTDDYVALCWTAVEGYSAFGSYEGTASSTFTTPFIYTGMRPRWILVKNADDGTSASDWFIYDTARSTFNAVDDQLYPNRNNAEATASTHAFDVLSNGFKVRSTSTSALSNKNENTYVWAAFSDKAFSLNGGLAR